MYRPSGDIDLRQVMTATAALRQGKVAAAAPPSTGMSTMTKLAIGGVAVVGAVLIVRRLRRAR